MLIFKFINLSNKYHTANRLWLSCLVLGLLPWNGGIAPIALPPELIARLDYLLRFFAYPECIAFSCIFFAFEVTLSP